MKPFVRTFTFQNISGTFIACAALLAVTITLPASVITWEAARNIAGESDVSTAGSLVGAFNLGGEGVTNTTVNGVTFTGLAVNGTSTTSGNFNLSSAYAISGDNTVLLPGPFGLSTSYETLISSNIGTFGLPIVLTMNGLTAGATYEFEWWSSNNWGSPTYTRATAGNIQVLGSTVGEYGPYEWLPGQFGIGTFVADNTALETINFSTGYYTQINAIQLRQTATVPEAGSTFILFGLGILVLIPLSRAEKRSRA